MTEAPLEDIVIVADNQSSHKSQSTRAFLEEHGINILFLPPYSSPLNPIEHVWAAFKALWRKRMARQFDKCPQENIEQLVGEVLDMVRISPRLLDSITKAVARVLDGQLV